MCLFGVLYHEWVECSPMVRETWVQSHVIPKTLKMVRDEFEPLINSLFLKSTDLPTELSRDGIPSLILKVYSWVQSKVASY